jgi:hypothetical protein
MNKEPKDKKQETKEQIIGELKLRQPLNRAASQPFTLRFAPVTLYLQPQNNLSSILLVANFSSHTFAT